MRPVELLRGGIALGDGKFSDTIMSPVSRIEGGVVRVDALRNMKRGHVR